MRGTLTAITCPIRGSRRRTLFIDGEAWMTTSRDVLARLTLEPGDEHDLDDLLSTIAEAIPGACRARAIELLARRDYGTAELVRRLSDEGLPRDGCVRAVAALAVSGYVDDERRAASLARTLVEVRGYGRARALRAMIGRDIDPEAASRALDAVVSADEETERAAALARRLAPAARGSVDRLAARLVRRGFTPGLALRCSREALAPPGEGEDVGLLDP
ncbi:MAG: hypothetical protein C0418_02930 [Coriobacteriaceae bacterium]|nr:hypothetical protein [Coriobacteriaceae bacterium]